MHSVRPGLQSKHTASEKSMTVAIGFHDISFALTCFDCKTTSPSVRSLSEHLKNSHSVSYAIAKENASKVSQAIISHCSTVGEHRLTSAYHNAPIFYPSTVTPFYLQGLPPLADLPVKDGQLCIVCGFATTSLRSMRARVTNVHNISEEQVMETMNAVNCKGVVPVQTLFGGWRTKYFPITSGDPIGSLICVQDVQLPSDNEGGCDRDVIQPSGNDNRLPQILQCLTPSSSQKKSEDPGSREVNLAVEDIFKDLSGPCSSVIAEEDPTGDSERLIRDTFLSQTEFDLALDALSLSMPQAAYLSGAHGSSDSNAVLKRI